MADLFATGRVADVILSIMVLEVAVLWLYRRTTGRGPTIVRILPNLVSGGCLVIALRLALSGTTWTWIAIALSAALAAHLWDLSRQWR
jgi:hypothetical protein